MTREIIYTWSSVAAIVITSCAGDVLLSRAMKQVGDVGELWRRTGVGCYWTYYQNPWFICGVLCMTLAFYSLLFALSWNDVSSGRSSGCGIDVCRQCSRRENIFPREGRSPPMDCRIAGGGRSDTAGSVGFQPLGNSLPRGILDSAILFGLAQVSPPRHKILLDRK